MATIICFVLSAVFVDLVGYFLHRWAHRPTSPLYRAHMTHHVVNYPPKAFFSTKYRSSRSDGLAIWFAPFGLVYSIAVLISGIPHPWTILLGGATVAVISSIAHDLTHIGGSIMWKWKILKGVAIRHHTHHFKMGRNFGIITPLWDVLFRTRRPPARSSR